jgi:hypothetical protein
VSDGEDGVPGAGVPAGGTAGQVLKKASGMDYDTEWGNEPSVPVQDVQIDGVSVLSDGVANVPMADNNVYGAARLSSDYNIKAGQFQTVISTDRQHKAVFYGLAKAAGSDEKNSTLPVGQYTDSAKSVISQMLNGSVSVTGSTPTITALPGIRYVCGECATLDITLPASGIVDVVFESGATATVLTITPPTGVTVKWANGFDPDNLDANTTYEIDIADGLGVAASWT